MSDPGTGKQSEEAQGSDASNDAGDAQRRFREALERKNAQSGEHPGNASAPGQKLKGSNSKRKREFRRKSGG